MRASVGNGLFSAFLVLSMTAGLEVRLLQQWPACESLSTSRRGVTSGKSHFPDADNRCSSGGGHGNVVSFRLKHLDLVYNVCAKAYDPSNPRSVKELQFYSKCFRSASASASDGAELPATFCRHIPAFFGRCMIGKQQYFIMQNLGGMLPQPRFMDVKIGAFTSTKQDSGGFKRFKMFMGDLFSGSITRGFRVASKESMGTYIESLAPGNFAGQRDALQCVLKELAEMQQDIAETRPIKLVGASVLVVVSRSVAESADSADNPTKRQRCCLVKVIDFAHAWDSSDSPDTDLPDITQWSQRFQEGLSGLAAKIGKKNHRLDKKVNAGSHKHANPFASCFGFSCIHPDDR